jgi:hypothetical protein
MGASTSFLDLLLQVGGSGRQPGETITLVTAAATAPHSGSATGASNDGRGGEGGITTRRPDADNIFSSAVTPALRGLVSPGTPAAGPSPDPAPLPEATAPALLSAADPLTLAAGGWNSPVLAGGAGAICDCRICREGLLPGKQTRAQEGRTTIGAAGTATSTTSSPLGSSVDLGRTFFLHSNPTATKTIYLDFDGHTTTGTAWNTYYGPATINTSAYDFDGNVNAFSNAELERIQFIWQRVAEDFAPFGINVTTQDPGADALTNTGGSDTRWGVRAAIGGSYADWYKNAAGGVSFVDVFGNASYGPSFIFSNDLGLGDEKYTAEAISHEVGHALGLQHDGTSTTSYFNGQGSGATGWASIMGAGYYQPVTQWSQGEYGDANNKQDDLAVISGTTNNAGYRVDDFGNSASTARVLSGSTLNQFGVIETRGDSDWFSFCTGSGNVTLSIASACQAWMNDGFGNYSSTLLAGRSPNLDIAANLYSADGTLIASSNPLDSLAASFSLSLSAGTYFLQVDGVGFGDPLSNGYSDYGSLGQYLLTGSLTSPASLVISAPTTLLTSEAGGSASFSVRLSQAPTANVVVSLASSKAQEGGLSITQLSFDANNWNTDQSVTVKGIDDTVRDGDQSYQISLVTTSSDALFNGITNSLAAINTDNEVGNLVMGDANNNTLSATSAKDILTGGGGADTFVFASLSRSTLANFDRITDFAIGTDRLDGPTSVQASRISRLGAVSTFDAAGIGRLLTTSTFAASRAATFTFADTTGMRTFIALNDGVAGFSASKDAIVEITGYSGSLSNLAVI